MGGKQIRRKDEKEWVESADEGEETDKEEEGKEEQANEQRSTQKKGEDV